MSPTSPTLGVDNHPPGVYTRTMTNHENPENTDTRDYYTTEELAAGLLRESEDGTIAALFEPWTD